MGIWFSIYDFSLRPVFKEPFFFFHNLVGAYKVSYNICGLFRLKVILGSVIVF